MKKCLWFFPFYFFLFLLLKTPCMAAVTPSLIANRTAGVAPLSVHFNASGSTSTLTASPFHDLHYTWDFGNDNGSAWRTGHSRNTDFGPVAGHVFEDAGTYTVTLTVTDLDGSTVTDSVTITVDDPDTVFAANTVCIALDDTDWTGAPGGATQLVVPDDDTLLSTIGSRINSGARRILLRRGDQWDTTESIGIYNIQGPGMIGAFGSGEKPILHDTNTTGNTMIGLDGLDLDFAGGDVYDWRVMDIMFWGETVSGETNQGVIASVKSSNPDEPARILIMNLDIYNFHSAIAIESDEASIVNCRVVRLIGENAGGGAVSWIAGADKFLFLGNHYDGAVEYARATEHLLRTNHINDAVLSHNVMMRSGRLAMKIHAEHNNDGTPPTYDLYSKRLVFSDNYFYGGMGPMSAWTLTIAPQHSEVDERLEDVIIERNYFEESSLTQTLLTVAATNNMTIRNNTFNTLLNGSAPISIGRFGDTFNIGSSNVNLYNNTCISSSDNAFSVLDSSTYTTDIDLYNNLYQSPTGTGVIVTSAYIPDYEASNNLVTADACFLSPLPSPITLPSADAATASLTEWNTYINTVIAWENQTNSFKITKKSEAVNAGLTLNTVKNDFINTKRPRGAGYDIGAFEYTPQGMTPAMVLLLF